MTDLSTLSDDDLKALLAPPTATPTAAPKPLSAMSDAELSALHGGLPVSPPSTGMDVAKSVGSGAVTGGVGLLGLAADIPDLARRLAMTVVARPLSYAGIMPKGVADALIAGPEGGETERPGAATIGNTIKSVAGDYDYTPQTTEGKYAKTISEFVPGAATVGGGIRQLGPNLLKFAAIPGAASEGAGELTQGTKLEPWARLGGALLGNVPGAIFNLRSAPKEILADVAQTLTPQQRIQTEMLMASAAAKGSPLSLAEAVQSVTGGGTRLGDVQRVIEQSARGGPTMKRFYADRPAGNDTMVRSSLDEVTPSTEQPFEVAPRVQGAAQREVDRAVGSVNEASAPAYAETANNPEALLSQGGFDKLRSNAAIEGAIKAVREDPIKYGDLRALPDHSVPVLDSVKKYLGDVAEASAQKGENFGAKNAGDAANLVRDAIVSEYPRYGSALNLQSMGRANLVEPLERSATGQLAAAEQFPAQAKIIFNPSPLPGSEKDVADAVKAVAARDPEAAAQFVRQSIEQTFNEATQRLQSGANQAGGAKFSAIIAGNSQQAKNLEAAMRALPGGDAAWADFRRTLDVLDAQGYRQAAGSMTESNRLLNESLKGGQIGETAVNAINVPKYPSWIQNAYQGYRYGKNTGQMADLLTQQRPSLLNDLARYPTGGTARGALTSALINSPVSLNGGSLESLASILAPR